MRLRARRRNLVVWSPSIGPADRYGAPGLARTRRIRTGIRIAAVLTVVGVRPRWRPLLAGVVLTVVGVMLPGLWSMVAVPGLWFLVYALLIPDADGKRRVALERELAAYSTPAQRCDLEATLDGYPDAVTGELREILVSQALAVSNNGLPGAGR